MSAQGTICKEGICAVRRAKGNIAVVVVRIAALKGAGLSGDIVLYQMAKSD